MPCLPALQEVSHSISVITFLLPPYQNIVFQKSTERFIFASVTLLKPSWRGNLMRSELQYPCNARRVQVIGLRECQNWKIPRRQGVLVDPAS
jgi:hypothetical protein